jgi:hypothetical protein
MRLGTGQGLGAMIMQGPREAGGPAVDIAESSIAVTPNPFETDASGAVAIELRDANADPVQRSFALVPRVAVVDMVGSFVDIDEPFHPADGTTPQPIYIELVKTERDAEGQYLKVVGFPASRVVVKLNGSTTGVTQPTGFSSISGELEGLCVTSVIGANEVTVEIDGIPLTDTASFTGDGEAPPPSEPATPFKTENFSGGVKHNDNGFSWGNTGSRVFVSDVNPRAGQTHSLHFVFGPDAHLADSNAEQRYNLGRNCTHYGVRYRLFIPANYKHRAQSGSTVNNKFHMVWSDAPYSDVAGGTLRTGFEVNRGGDFQSNIRCMSSRWNYNSWDSSNPFGDYNVTGQGSPLISIEDAAIIGAWNLVEIEMKPSTDRTTADGIQRMWVNGALVAHTTTAKLNNFYETPAPPAAYRNGYLIGWANSGYEEETIFQASEFEFFDVDPEFPGA